MSPASHEFALIEWFRAHAGGHPRLSLGIGDDAAAIRVPGSPDLLLASDMLLDGVHFQVPPLTFREVGRKALAVNLSDIAAMAGEPLAAVVSVALPHHRGTETGRELYEGLRMLAEEFGVAVAGGDTNTWKGPLVVDVAILGEAGENGPVARGGALRGDWIFVTGSLGGSLLSGGHASFCPRIREAQQLSAIVELHAMIDISDGMAVDLHRILDESRTGAVVYAERVPISEASKTAWDDKSPLEHALGDGEDFELLFTVSPEDGEKLLSQSPIGLPLSHIGEVVEADRRELVEVDGTRRPLLRSGWEHQL